MAAAAAVVACVYYIFDPMSSGWPLQCPSHLITGLQCPGCGSQRALHALLHLDIAGAMQANALVLPGLAVMALLLVTRAWPGRLPRTERALGSGLFGRVLLALVAVWTVVRNLL